MGSGRYFGKEKYLLAKNVSDRRGKREECESEIRKKSWKLLRMFVAWDSMSFSLNGKKIGDSEFAPLWSDYDKSVYYNTYDVTEQLQDGENVVGILLGNGFYNVQGGRYRKLQISLVLHTFI